MIPNLLGWLVFVAVVVLVGWLTQPIMCKPL
jgi:hypothetical protein